MVPPNIRWNAWNLSGILKILEFPKIFHCKVFALVTVMWVVEDWADQVGGLNPLCSMLAYSEPTRAESREGSSGLAESSRVT